MTHREARASLLALALMATLFSGCGRSLPDKGRVRQVYRAALPADILGFDPATANDVPTARALGATHQTLLQYAYLERPFRVVPDLAAAMPAVSKDRLTYTFTLRKGVRYHPDPCFETPTHTREMVASDFVYAWKRVADPRVRSGGWWVFDGWIEGISEWRAAGADYAKPIAGLLAPDNHTLVVRLTRPYPQLLYILTMVFSAPVPPEAVKAYGDDLRDHSIGTGPFVLKSWVRGSRIHLVKNPDYHDERYPSTGSDWAREHGMLEDAGKRLPFLDEIIYSIILEPQPAWLEFQAGSLDRAEIPKDSFHTVITGGTELAAPLKAKGVQVQVWPSQTQWWIGMNLEDPVFQGDPGRHLRFAIAYSHDAARFIELIQSGRGRPALSLIPPDLPSYDESAFDPIFRYDPERARAELARAGWPEGKGAPRLRLDLRGPDPHSRQVGEYLAQELGAIGLEVELVPNTYQRFLQKAKQGQVQLYFRRWIGDYPDEENWTQLLFSKNRAPGPNYSNHSNPAYDALHERTRVMEDSPERRRLIQEMINMGMAECPLRLSFLQTNYVLHHRWLGNFMFGEPIYNWQKYLKVDAEDRTRGF